MNRTSTVVLAMGVAGLVASCTEHEPRTPPPATVQPRVSAAEAVNRIAAARCEKEDRCNPPTSNTKAEDTQACRISVKRDLDKSFGNNQSCQNGVSLTDLDQCINKLHAQDCGVMGTVTEGLQASLACGDMDLCMR